MSDYVSQCERSIVSYLSNKYETDYEEKDKSLLMNKGIVGYQHIHVDAKPECDRRKKRIKNNKNRLF